MFECIQNKPAFYIAYLLGFVIPFIPYAGNFVGVLNTLFHEFSHALMALLSSGEAEQIQLESDSSGTARTKSKYWLGKVITVLAGYTGASVSAVVLSWLYLHYGFKGLIFFVLSVGLSTLILWIRNLFGWIWLLVFLSINVVLYLYGSALHQEIFAGLCLGISGVKMLSSTITLIRLSVSQPAKAGDAGLLQQFTYIPAVLWAIFFMLFALYCLRWQLVHLPCGDWLQGRFLWP